MSKKTIEEKFEEWFLATDVKINDELDYEATKKEMLEDFKSIYHLAQKENAEKIEKLKKTLSYYCSKQGNHIYNPDYHKDEDVFYCEEDQMGYFGAIEATLIENQDLEEAVMPTEFKITVFIGVDGKFVLVKGFDQSDEHLGGLHEMLDDFLGYDDYLSNDPLKMGFYEVELEIEQNMSFNPERDMSDAYFVAKNIKKIEVKL